MHVLFKVRAKRSGVSDAQGEARRCGHEQRADGVDDVECLGHLRGRLEKRFAGLGIVIQALDVDRQEPWPYGQDRQEDQALSL